MFLLFLLVQCVFSHSRSFVLCHFQLHPNCLPLRTFHEWRFASKHSHTRRCKCRIFHFCLECPASCTKPEWLGQKSNGIMILEYPRYLRYKFVKETNLLRSCKASVCAHLEGSFSSLALCPFLKSFGFHDNLQSQPGRIIVQLGMLLFWLLDALSRLNQVILFLVHVIHVPFK